MGIIATILAILCSITTEFVCHAITRPVNCSESELEALIDFKNGLNDPENRLSSWRGSNCCQWRGIVCDNKTASVITIDLHNPYPFGYDSTTRIHGYWNLSGEIRPSLLKLKSLKHFDLSNNTFQDIPVPEFLASLKNLQYLSLSQSGFTGFIPPSLGNLSNLQYLDLSSQFRGLTVDNIQWMTGLVSLKHLEMDRVDLSYVGSSFVEVLNMLPYLTELHLSGCLLSGSISSLNFVNFTSLSVIHLSDNEFNPEFPDWVVNISSLVDLDLSNCGLIGRIPLALGELPNLRYLELSMNDLGANCLELFRGSWKQTEILSLGLNKLHGSLPASISNMTLLSEFDLFVNRVEGGIPSTIGKLCNLKYINLSGNNMTGRLPELLEGTDKCISTSPLPSLVNLRLSNNRLVDRLPEWLGQLENLEELQLNFNLFEGSIPDSLGTLQKLKILGLGGNKLKGTLPKSFGQLSELSFLDVSSNHLTGFVSEAHFSNLRKLMILSLSSNSFILNVSSNWIPPFQAGNLDLGSCQLGPSFPAWLESQKQLKFLDISNASILGSIPNWFWKISSNLSLLNVSLNHIEGQLPNPLNIAPFADIDFSSNLIEGSIPLPIVEIELLDMSKNRFSGPIPRNISESMANLIFLSLSNNQLTGEIPASIGQMQLLQVIDLSSNKFIGNIPSSIKNCTYLKALDLGFNNLSGLIPSSLGQLKQLQTLHLNENKFSGVLPSSFQNLSNLETLDLGNNRISGIIPSWFGDNFTRLRIFRLRSNSFSGKIPSELSNLTSLQVLDLAENNLSGNIPSTFGDFKAMIQEQKINQYLFYGNYRGLYYEESLVVSIKSQFQKYSKTLSLVTSIDLSENNLDGDFPVELTKLAGLVVLNISGNQISGQIPETISSLRQLASLDLSSNKFSGSIPPSMSILTFLGDLNVSNNNLSGMIPYKGQLSTFDESAFGGNPNLCGAPLLVKCRSSQDSDEGENVDNQSNNTFTDKWFYWSILGFITGIVIPYLTLMIIKPWRDAYFSFVDKTVHRLSRLSSRRTVPDRN